jgi:hypothetical protein
MMRALCHPVLCQAAALVAMLLLLAAPATAATLNFTVNASEPVAVTGTPRLAIDVGGTTRYATYDSGSGTSARTFAYAVQPGDFDANGITLASPVDLNGGSITDLAGNPASGLTFTLPDTSALKVQTYTAAFTTSPITNTNANAVSFAIAKAPTGASFTYSITSSGGAGTVSGSGTISGTTHAVSSVDVSALPSGTLTLSVTITTAAGGTGAARTNSTTPTLTARALDGLSPAAAYSTRRLRSAYAGPLLQVRRSTDNATQDIGTTVAGGLDVTALTSFCGSASCFVTTWYDQSGNARHASQATASLQPRLVNAGTLETENSLPSPYFNGTAGASLQTVNVILDFISNTIMAVCRNIGSTSTIGGVMASGTGGWGIFYAASVGYVVDGPAASAGNSANTSATSNFVQLSGMYPSTSTSNSSIYMNGTLAENYTGAGSGFPLRNFAYPIELGGRTAGGFTTRVFTGRISEAIMFSGAITNTDRQTLERNQGAWFGIAIP